VPGIGAQGGSAEQHETNECDNKFKQVFHMGN
jgi:hypothetical protein